MLAFATWLPLFAVETTGSADGGGGYWHWE